MVPKGPCSMWWSLPDGGSGRELAQHHFAHALPVRVRPSRTLQVRSRAALLPPARRARGARASAPWKVQRGAARTYGTAARKLLSTGCDSAGCLCARLRLQQH